MSFLSYGCATNPKNTGTVADDGNGEVVHKNKDPFEGFNRKVFVFNDGVDRWLAKPIAIGYKAITPDPVERGLRNFFGNLFELNNIVNDILQWKWRRAGNDSARFVLNTVGSLGGLVNVASKAGFEKGDGKASGQKSQVADLKHGPYFFSLLLGASHESAVLGALLECTNTPHLYLNTGSYPRSTIPSSTCSAS